MAAARTDPHHGPSPSQRVWVAEELACVVPRISRSTGTSTASRCWPPEPAPWLAVDPVLLRGDPEYDFARASGNGSTSCPGSPTSLTPSTCSSALLTSPDRALRWIVVRSMSYLLSGIPRGLTWDPPKCRRLLNLFS